MKRVVIVGLLSAVIITALFLYDFLFHISRPLSPGHGDLFLVYTIVGHWMDVITTGNWQDLPNLSMFYGIKNSLFFSDHHMFQAVLTLPWFLLTKNLVLSINIVAVEMLFLSYLSMYLLAYYLTFRIGPSVIASTIFVFNPYVLGRFPEQMILYTLPMIPVIFLSIEYQLRKKSDVVGFLFFISISLQLLSSLYYSAMLTVILPLYILIRFLQTQVSWRRFVTWGGAVGLLVFLTIAAWSYTSYKTALQGQQEQRSVELIANHWAPWAMDWFFTNSVNRLYGGLGGMGEKLFPSFVRKFASEEMNIFPGVIALLLFGLSFFITKLRTVRPLWIAMIAIFIISVLLAFGPYITIYEGIRLPNIYQLFYAIHPLFTYLRSTSRFALFVLFSLSLLSAFVLASLRMSRKNSTVLMIILLILLIIEYSRYPFEFYHPTASQKAIYAKLNDRSDIRVIVDLPIGNSVESQIGENRRQPGDDATYLLWATVLHRKKLLNGYSSFFPPVYFERANMLSIGFPTYEKLRNLKKWGVDAIVLHKHEYHPVREYDRVKHALELMGIPKVAENETEIIFDLL